MRVGARQSYAALLTPPQRNPSEADPAQSFDQVFEKASPKSKSDSWRQFGRYKLIVSFDFTKY